jgi:hypothetical protein
MFRTDSMPAQAKIAELYTQGHFLTADERARGVHPSGVTEGHIHDEAFRDRVAHAAWVVVQTRIRDLRCDAPG